MSAHQIAGTWNFEFWRGTPPPLPQYQISQHTRPGINGIGEQRVGRWHAPISATLVSHWSSYVNAMAVIDNYVALTGSGLVVVSYNSINWFGAYGIKFLVDGVEFVDCQARVRLIGPGYDYLGGAELITQWTLTPVEV